MNATDALLIEILDELVTLAGRDDVERADDIRRMIERLREAKLWSPSDRSAA